MNTFDVNICWFSIPELLQQGVLLLHVIITQLLFMKEACLYLVCSD